MNTFEDTVTDWESHDDWQYADKEAERKYFFLAGQRSIESIVMAVKPRSIESIQGKTNILNAIRKEVKP